MNPLFTVPVVAHNGHYPPNNTTYIYQTYPLYPPLQTCTIPYLQPYQTSLVATTPLFTNVYPVHTPQKQALLSSLPVQQVARPPPYPVRVAVDELSDNKKQLNSDCT